MIGRTLEFAISTAMITIVHIIFALWVASAVSGKIEELFSGLITALQLMG